MRQKITLKIAGRSYPLEIDAKKEELYRVAEKRVNELVTTIQQQRVKNFEGQDHLAITAFTLAMECVEVQRERTIQSEEVQTLINLESTIDAYLNDPTK